MENLDFTEETQECPKCLDSGWVPCDTPWCTENQWHGTYCSCDRGQERELEEENR